MKKTRILLISAMMVFSSISLFAQKLRNPLPDENDRYDGHWPTGKGVLYSYKEGLVLGNFIKGKAEGECVCYRLNGDVYWGEYKKGKATGHGRLYMDNGNVFVGEFKNGKYHGTDTLYRKNGSMFVGKFRNGRMKARISEFTTVPAGVKAKPRYPRVDLRLKHEEFLKELELKWEDRNLALRQGAGYVAPKFKGGGLKDFTFWVNSQVVYPYRDRINRESRLVIVEFTVNKDGTVSDIVAVFGSDPVLNEAAVKVVSKSPTWTPAEQDGEKIEERMKVPVEFNI